MHRWMAMLTKAPALSKADFRQRFEDRHLPALRGALPDVRNWRRSYALGVDAAPDHLIGADKADCDMVLEADGPDAGSAQRILSEIGESDLRLAQVYAVDWHASARSILAAPPTGHSGGPAIKLIAALKRNPDLTSSAFALRYEHGHCPLALQILADNGTPPFARYERNYLRAGDSSPSFDVITTMWFWNGAHHESFLRACADPVIASRLSADEAEIFDPSRMMIFLAEEETS